MINRFRNKGKRFISLLTGMIILVSSCALCTYATEREENKSTDDPIIIVSMGDSYSSGEGIEPFYGQSESIKDKVVNPDWLAHRSTKSWPSLLRVNGLTGTLAEHKDDNWFFVASSGAVTDNIKAKQTKEYSRGKYSGEYLLVPQIDVFKKFKKDTVDYVTLTFGGNDVEFTGILNTAVGYSFSKKGDVIAILQKSVLAHVLCVSFMNINNLTDKLNRIKTDFYADGGTEQDIEKAYSDIAKAAGVNARIIVAGYPKLIAQNGAWPFFNKMQAEEINESVSWFNDALSEIVTRCHDQKGMKIYFVSVEEAFNGHEAYTENEHINKIIWIKREQDLKELKKTPKELIKTLKELDLTSSYSIHPNEDGAKAYASCVQKKIQELEKEEDEPVAQDILEEEIEKHKQDVGEWWQQKIEDQLVQWLPENCDGS